MLGSFLTRGLVMAFGYIYPAYECYKTVERNKPEIEQLRFWCQYWILIACLTVFERIGDAFVSWVPMYSEAKLAFIIYLWYPKTMGTTYVYDSFFRPYVAKHENEIDRNLLELRTRAGDVAVVYWQRALSYGQTRIFDILQYVAAQSTPRPQPSQQQQRQPGARQLPSMPKHQAVPKPRPSTEDPPSPTSSSSSSQDEGINNVTENGGTSDTKMTIKKAISQMHNAQVVQSAQSNHSVDAEPEKSEESEESTPPTEAEPMQIETVVPLEDEEAVEPPIETVMEETIRVTRGRLRKTRSAVTK